MKILINHQPPTKAIAAEVIRQIVALNPSINPQDYKTLDDIPGFKEIMQRPRGIGIDKSDPKRHMTIMRKLFLLQRNHKRATVDFRRTEDGRTTVAALAQVRNKSGRLETKLIWEEEIGWEIFIE